MDSETIKQEIHTILAKMNFTDDVEAIDVYEGATKRFGLRLRGEANMLIGEHGNNLIALEHLIKKLLTKKFGEIYKFALDINDYRVKRLEGLKQDVKAAAKEVRLHNKEVSLQPMSSFERRIVHLLLAEYPDITTESIGREPLRKVVIMPYP